MEDLKKILIKRNFDKYLKNIVKKYKNKKIIIYGSGLLFQTINNNYDLSKLNIIGISDIKYRNEDKDKLCNGYKIIPLEYLSEQDFDILLLGVRDYYYILNNFK